MQPADEHIDTSRPHPARMYDYYLGGKDWFEADRAMAEKGLAVFPHFRTLARENRAFMQRATRVLAREHGVRQFLDIGSGIPTKPNLHQVAQAEAPESRVVYVDNDPLVMEYASALLRGTPEGRTAYAEADLKARTVTRLDAVRRELDFDRPIALSLLAVVHALADEDGPRELVDALVRDLPSGSFLLLSHATDEFAPELARRGEATYRTGGNTGQARSRAEIERFFDGLDLLDPGVVVAHRWRPETPPERPDFEVAVYAGAARKP